MALAVRVVLAVLSVTAFFAVVGYFINRSAERNERKEGDKA
jgi:hypothetical protein